MARLGRGWLDPQYGSWNSRGSFNSIFACRYSTRALTAKGWQMSLSKSPALGARIPDAGVRRRASGRGARALEGLVARSDFHFDGIGARILVNAEAA
jgi:hypothetical protein